MADWLLIVPSVGFERASVPPATLSVPVPVMELMLPPALVVITPLLLIAVALFSVLVLITPVEVTANEPLLTAVAPLYVFTPARVNVPPPVQSPPPIMIGGSGEKKTLRLVALYADACNVFGGSPEEVGHKLDVLRGHCDDAGRDYESIEKTMIYHGDPTGDPDPFLADMEKYAALGISMITAMPPTGDPVAWTTAMCESVVPRLSDIR